MTVIYRDELGECLQDGVKEIEFRDGRAYLLLEDYSTVIVDSIVYVAK